MGFFSNTDLKNQVKSLEEENKELKAQAGSVESLQGDNNRLSEELATANTALDVAKAKILESDKAVTEAGKVKAEAAKVIAEQPAKIAAASSSQVAALGVDPVAESVDTDSVIGVPAGSDAEYNALAKEMESCTSATARGVIAQKMLKIFENK